MKKIVLSLVLGGALVGCGGAESEPLTTAEGRNIPVSISYGSADSRSAMGPGGGNAPQDACKIAEYQCPTPDSPSSKCHYTFECVDPVTADRLCRDLIDMNCAP